MRSPLRPFCCESSAVRLTLRTLLAYLDDILPPAEAKALGEKIASSPIASQYVERIRDVMRRRRLTAPEPDGSGGGIEPNLVAEYLDNSLSSERVADVERVCLESDINLAEVAACHQILTLVLGEPVEISGRLRERMYALGPQGESVEVPKGNNGKTAEMSAREQLAAIQMAQRPKPTPEARPLESRLPDYLRPKPLWKRLLPWAAVAAVVLLWLGVFFYDPAYFGGFGGAEPVTDDAAPAAAGENAVADAPVDADGAADREPVDRQPEALDGDESPAVASTDLPELPLDPEPPADDQPVLPAEMTDRPDEPMPAAPDDDTALADATANPDLPEQPTPAPKPDEATAATEPAAPDAQTAPPAIDVVSTNGVVLRHDARANRWYPLADEEDPSADVEIAVPEPFEADVTIGDLPLETTVLGGTRLRSFGSTSAGPLGVKLIQGRLRLAGQPESPSKPEEMLFALRLGKALWRVEPLTPDTLLGIEALPLQPTGMNQDLSDRTPQGVVYVGRGAVRIADAHGRVEVASAGNRLILTPDGDGAIGTPDGVPAPAAESPAAELATGEDEEIDNEDAETVAADATDATDAETAAAAAADAAPDAVDASGEDIVPAPAELEPSGSSRGLPMLAKPDDPVTDEPLADDPVAADEELVVDDEDAIGAGTPAVSGLPIGVPEWLTSSEPTSAARRAMVAYRKEFVAGVPVGQSLLPAVDSPLYYVAEPAAKALGLIEDVDGMVKALRDSEHPEAVLAAIDGLRNWLGRSPENGVALQRHLQLVFPRQGMAEILEQLLWGYDLDDARDEATARQLVEWLDHPEAVVRELAFYHVRRLSGRTMHYRPNQTPSDRIGAINRWRDFVRRNGGLLIE